VNGAGQILAGEKDRLTCLKRLSLRDANLMVKRAPAFTLLLIVQGILFESRFAFCLDHNWSCARMEVTPTHANQHHNLGKESAMTRQLSLAIILAVSCTAAPTWAAPQNRPQAEYSADSTMQTEEGTIQQKIFVTPTKERKEMLTGAGDGGIMIFRFDSKVLWILMPSEKMYMENSMAGGQGQSQREDPSQWTYEDTAMGDETLNGVKVTKYKTIATSTDGKKYGGFSWRTKEGINLKQDLLYKEGNEKKRMLTELTNVQIGRQDPKLFEIPEGFTKFDMGGMMGGMMGRQGMGQPMSEPPPNRGRGQGRPQVMTPQENQPAPEPEPATQEPSDLEKAGNFMKGLFGR
jgi:Domain of unknown function (DUF4412)